MLRRRAADRGGFTLVEVAVVATAIAVIATITITMVSGRVRDAQASAIVRDLASLGEAVAAFRGNVGRYPRTLTELSAAPVTGDDDSCQQDLPAGLLQQWRGPYINRVLTSGGLRVGDSTVQNTTRRVPANISGGNYGVLYLDITDVDQDVATRVEQAVDGNVNFAAGAVLWTDLGGGRGTLSYGIPIRGC